MTRRNNPPKSSLVIKMGSTFRERRVMLNAGETRRIHRLSANRHSRYSASRSH
jgi:hypothetical protein